MLGLRNQAIERILAQARAQAVDQRDFDLVGIVARQETQIAARERRGLVARKRDRFDRRR